MAKRATSWPVKIDWVGFWNVATWFGVENFWLDMQDEGKEIK